MRPRPDAIRPRSRPRPERVRPKLRPRPNDLASRPHGPRGLNIPARCTAGRTTGLEHRQMVFTRYSPLYSRSYNWLHLQTVFTRYSPLNSRLCNWLHRQMVFTRYSPLYKIVIVSCAPFALHFCPQRWWSRHISWITCVLRTKTVTNRCYVNRQINVSLL